MRVALLFPPTWSLNTGSPHLAIPLLAAQLRAVGIDVLVRDLNWEFANSLRINITAQDARFVCQSPTISSMNEPYFAAEDRLMEIASHFGGSWNAQFGYRDEANSRLSSQRALHAATCESPFSEYFRNDVLPSLAEFAPDVVGFSISASEQLVPTLELCNLIREAKLETFIVLGGNTITRLLVPLKKPKFFALFDGMITGQGEHAVITLCDVVRTGESLSQVPQLTWMDNDTVISNSQSSTVDIDRIPTPDFSSLPVGDYWGENYIPLVAERGCYYGKCNFCAIPFGWGNGGYVGRRSAPYVAKDMQCLIERHGIPRFKFVDEAMSPHTLRELSSILITERIDCAWEAYVRLEEAWGDLRFVESLAGAGFRKGYFGLEIIESANRNQLNKKDNLDPRLLLERCNAVGIKVHLFCMFGFPGTTVADAHRTTDFVIENQDLIDTVDVFPWVLARHTSVPNVEPIPTHDDDLALEFAHRSAGSSVLSAEQIIELADECEDRVWNECPRMLHPTYRLVSPWCDNPALSESASCDIATESTSSSAKRS